ncbi:MAG: choice-of-anchor D domain-containing protein [Rhodocyclaceae bacterium]|nr:choice-of-anchor D domain-containing protein [Rhodocyclaceae bacterium]
MVERQTGGQARVDGTAGRGEAHLQLALRADAAKDVARLSARVEAFVLVDDRGERLRHEMHGRLIEVEAGGTALHFALAIPPGAYRGLRIEFASLEYLRHGCSEGRWRKVAACGRLDAALELQAQAARSSHVALDIDSERLLGGGAKSSAAALRARVVDGGVTLEAGSDGERRIHAEVALADLRVGLAGRLSVAAERGALAIGTTIRVELDDPDALPPLLHRQRALGPIVRIRVGQLPQAPLEITVPYDEQARRAAGVDLDQLVVLALDERRQRYRELLPFRVDRVANTITARTRTLSWFFAGSPGFRIDHPEFGRNAGGEVVAVSALAEVVLSGRAADDAALVRCDAAAGGWSRLGHFVFEGVPLAGAETQVTLVAEVEGRVAHELSLPIRRPMPTKTVTDPARLYGTAVGVSSGFRSFVAALINQSAFREDTADLIDQFRGWQLEFNRPAPYLYWFDAEVQRWRYERLMPDAYLENQVAGELIADAPEVIGRLIPLDPAYPEESRALRSLRDFYAPILARGDLVSLLVAIALRAALDQAARHYAAGQFSYGPAPAMLVRAEDEVELALVAATSAARRQAAGDPMAAMMRAYVTPAWSDDDLRPRVLAGALYLIRAYTDGRVEREKVADGLWCSTVALKRHPQSGRSHLLAIALAEPAGAEPRSALMLFERRAAADYRAELVSADFPIVDADLAFDGGGEPFVVASYRAEEPGKPHMLSFRRGSGGWRASPISWRDALQPDASDIGTNTRVVADPAGQITLAFSTPVLNPRFGSLDLGSRWRWMVGRPDSAGWSVKTLGSGSIRSLGGDMGASNRAGLAPGFVGQSARGLPAFAPALAVQRAGQLLCAFGNGALRLAAIDRATLSVDTRLVDIDRRTGFAPSIAVNPAGVPSIAYKDDFGSGNDGPAASDGLMHFTAAAGNFVPDPDLRSPLSPSHGRISVSIEGFAPYVPMNCNTVRDVEGLNALLDSVLMHRRLHVDIAEGGLPRVVLGVYWAYFDSHRGLNRMIDALPQPPRTVQMCIDNSDHAGEGIDKIFLTVIAPLARVQGDFAQSLDAGAFPLALRDALVNVHGLRMTRADLIGVQRVLAAGEDRNQPGSHWRVRDPNPFNERRLTLPDPALASTNREFVAVDYELRRVDGDWYEISVPPLLTVHDSPRFVDADGHYAPCRIAQPQWDIAAEQIAPVLAGAIPNIGFDDGPDVRQVRIANARITRLATERFPGGDQQNDVRFTLTVGSIWARGTDPDHFDAAFTAYTTGASQFQIPIAPYIDAFGNLAWWTRAVQARIGPLEVDVRDWGDLEFIKVIASFVPVLGGLAIVLADAVIDDIATDEASAQFRTPGIGGIRDLLARRFAVHAAARLPRPARRFDAVHVDAMRLRLWYRTTLRESPPLTAFDVLPAAIHLGSARVDEVPAPRRNFLLMNTGQLPVALDGIEFVPPGDEFRLFEPLPWPRVLAPGDAEVLGIEFAPQLPAGERSRVLRIHYDGGRAIERRLAAIALAPRRPVIRSEPALLNFGVVVAGQQGLQIARVFNEGDAELDVTAFEILAEAAAAGLFATDAVPIRLAPGIGMPVAVRYTPQASSAPHRARLRIHSNDPVHPVSVVSLFGQSASGALRVEPARIDFNPSGLLPTLPYGIGQLRTVYVYNTGTATLTIPAAAFHAVDAGGAPSPHFVLAEQGLTVVNNVPIPPPPMAQVDRQIAAGNFLVLTVMFTPVSAGSHQAEIRFSATDPAAGFQHLLLSGSAS